MTNGFVNECRAWWRLGSIWTMGFWAALGSVIVAIWPVAHWAFDTILPRYPLWRIPFAAATFAVTFGSMFYARMKAQPRLQAKLAPPPAAGGEKAGG
jgi:hypothetical protein